MAGSNSISDGAKWGLNEFTELLHQAVKAAIQKAQEEVSEPLPEANCYQLAMQGKEDRPSTLEEVVGDLSQRGQFPRLIDVAIRGVTSDGEVVVWLRPSAHPWVMDIESTWDPSGLGPFKIVGLLIPSFLWERPRPFRLADLLEAAAGWPA